MSSVLTMSACSGGSSSQPTSTVAPSTTSEASTRVSDGELRIGLLLPRQVLDDAQAMSLQRVLESTLRVLNANGGFNDRPVGLFTQDESNSADATTRSIENLLDSDVDAIIGPSSSGVAVQTASKIIDAGVGWCSPMATSILLNRLPDQGLMIRTSRTDTSLSESIKEMVDDEGVAVATVLYPDDPYGRAFNDDLRSRLLARGLNQPTSENSSDASNDDLYVSYRVTDTGDYEADVPPDEISSAVIVFIGNAQAASALLPDFGLRRVIVSDSLTSVANTELATSDLTQLGLTIRGVVGDPYAGADRLTEFLQNLDPDDADITAAEVPWVSAFVDCLNVIALSAVSTGSDDPSDFMSQATEVTTGGSACDSFLDCLGYLREPRDFDYDGPTGELDLDSSGDAVNGTVLTYRVTTGGRVQVTGSRRIDVRD